MRRAHSKQNSSLFPVRLIGIPSAFPFLFSGNPGIRLAPAGPTSFGLCRPFRARRAGHWSPGLAPWAFLCHPFGVLDTKAGHWSPFLCHPFGLLDTKALKGRNRGAQGVSPGFSGPKLVSPERATQRVVITGVNRVPDQVILSPRRPASVSTTGGAPVLPQSPLSSQPGFRVSCRPCVTLLYSSLLPSF